MVGRLALLAVARAVCVCATLLPLVPAVAAAVAFRPPVLVARASPDCTNCPRPNWITPACDGFISLGRGVIVSPWNQGLSFALSLDNGKSWRNRTQLQPDPGALLLSGGRLCKDLDPAQSCIPTQNGEGGVILWVNTNGMADLDGGRNGTEWAVHCVTAAHNRGWDGDPSLLFNETTPTQVRVRPCAPSAHPLFTTNTTSVYRRTRPSSSSVLARLESSTSMAGDTERVRPPS